MIANILTFSRIILIIPAIYFLRIGQNHLSLIVFVVACITDYLDGFVARRFDNETMLGKLLDPLADKVLYIAALFLFLERGYITPLPFIPIIARELLVLGYGPVVIMKMGDIIAGKIKNMFQFISLGLILIFGRSLISTISIWVSVTVTMLSGLIMLLSNYQQISKSLRRDA